MDQNNNKAISLEEFQRYFLLHPSSSASDIVKYWRRNVYIDIDEEAIVPPEGVENAWIQHLIAGGVAGAVSRTSTAPLDRLKVFLQVYASRNNGYRVVTSLQFLLKEGGLSGRCVFYEIHRRPIVHRMSVVSVFVAIVMLISVIFS